MTLLGAEERIPSFEGLPPELVVEGASPEDISVRYYEIAGLTLEALKSAMKERGPKDALGATRAAFAGWYLRWRWPRDEHGKPDFAKTTVACTGTVTLPRWRFSSDATPALMAEWRRYFGALLQHERKHLEHCFSNRGKVRDAVIAAARAKPDLTAEEANTLVHRHLREIRALDLSYDSATEHGKNEGVELRH